MANEIGWQHDTSGETLYAVIRNNTNQCWNGSAFETYATANLGNYDIALTMQGTASLYHVGTWPAAIKPGVYQVYIYVRAGASPAEGDQCVGSFEMIWKWRETRIAMDLGKSTVTDNGDGTYDVAYTDPDGTTTRVTFTFNTSGEWPAVPVYV